MKDPSRYELLGEHGRGGIGVVVEAFDVELDRTVAMKQLHRTSDIGEARFVREAKITARLEHPGIVPVYEAGRWPNGSPFYCMKLVGDHSLHDCIRDAKTLTERLALVSNVLAVAEAVGYAHSQRIIHRDLKPGNVMIGEFGETVVIDWGLAKDLAEHDESCTRSNGDGTTQPDLTGAGAVVGTPSYMAPEQACGGDVDERSDVYSLGAMLYHVLTGQVPFHGESAEEVLTAVAAASPTAPRRLEPRLPDDLCAIVAKAMRRSPSDRYATAKEFAEDLRRFHTGRLVAARRYSSFSRALRWIVEHGPIILVMTGVVTVLGLALILEKQARDAQDRAQSAQDEAATERSWAERLAQERNRLLGEVEQYLPLEVRFARGATNPALENELHALMPAIVTAATTKAECRADVCKLELRVQAENAEQVSDWWQWQASDVYSTFSSVQTQRGQHYVDPLDGEMVALFYFLDAQPQRQRLDGGSILDDLINRFEASGAAIRCDEDYPGQRGTFTFELDLGIATSGGGFAVLTPPSLAGTDFGTCIADKLEHLMRASPPPQKYVGGIRSLNVVAGAN